MSKYVLILAIVIFLIFSFKNNKSQTSIPSANKKLSAEFSVNDLIIASNLEVPWSLVFLPDKSLLVTERPGRVRIIDSNGNLSPKSLINLPEVKPIGEGGLLGIAIHPDFPTNKYVYLYYTYSSNNDNTYNRVARYTLDNNNLINETVILDSIPGSINHNGGRIKFGPDNYLYITTGDAQNPSQAEDTNSLAGKILRVTDSGLPVPDNPFNNAVYSYGHRNPQGLAWDENNQLWSTEHGRSGIQSGLDEINKIYKGKNYGWPNIQGDETGNSMETPIKNSGSETWAPASAVFFQQTLFFGGLRGQTLYELDLNNNLSLSKHLINSYGRIRDVLLGPDNFLYITTSNRDNRGKINPGDDKIIRIDPTNL